MNSIVNNLSVAMKADRNKQNDSEINRLKLSISKLSDETLKFLGSQGYEEFVVAIEEFVVKDMETKTKLYNAANIDFSNVELIEKLKDMQKILNGYKGFLEKLKWIGVIVKPMVIDRVK